MLCGARQRKPSGDLPGPARQLQGHGEPRACAADIRKWITSPKEMEAALPTKPKISMKAYASLKPEDLDALVAYLQSLKKS